MAKCIVSNPEGNEVKTTLRCHLTPSRRAATNKAKTSVGEDAGKGSPLHGWREREPVQPPWEQRRLLQTFKEA